MKFKIYRLGLLLIILALALAACDPADDDEVEAEEEEIPTPTAVITITPPATPVAEVPAVPPEVEQYAAEWPMANKDYANTRVAENAQINAGNVHELGVAWTFAIPGIGLFGAAASNPLVAGGVVYLQDLASNVYALNFDTGELIWHAGITEASVGPNGPALGWGKVFVQDGLHTLIALDAASGEEVWAVELDGPTGAHQPYVYGGYVFTSIQAGAVEFDLPGEVIAARGYAGGASGMAYAVDQANGEIIWRFIAVEEGFWGNPEVNSGGGIWYPPAIDPESGLTFWGTGNPAPFPGTVEYPNAASRPGPNLYTNALVALDLLTGEMAWYNQVKPRDLFDLDFQISPILTTIQFEGQARDVVIGSGKLGRVLAFDRLTGETLWDTWVGIHENDELQEIPVDEITSVYPGILGGVETPMALADGVVYVPVVNMSSPYTADAFGAEDGTEAVGNVEARTIFEDGTSELVAIDANTGEILWSTAFEQINFGGATVVNDLVFTATYDGTVYALARDDGRIVWSYQVPGGINAWPAVVGDTILWPVGIASPPVLLALRLGATGEIIQTGEEPTPLPTP